MLLLGGRTAGLGLGNASCLAGEYGGCGGSLTEPGIEEIPCSGKAGIDGWTDPKVISAAN